MASTFNFPQLQEGDFPAWQAIVENKFRAMDIQDKKKKFYTIAGSLPQHLASQLCEVIMAEPTDESYDLLMKKLAKICGPSIISRQKELMNLKRGSDKPSDFLRKIKRLAVGTTLNDENLVKIIFNNGLELAHIPSLVTQGAGENLATYAERLDDVIESAGSEMRLRQLNPNLNTNENDNFAVQSQVMAAQLMSQKNSMERDLQVLTKKLKIWN